MASRVIEILGLFRTQEAPWTVEALARETGVSASSVYRDVQELVRAGFLGAVTGAGYVLGPAFVEYDRLTRLRDPLIALGSAQMRDLIARTSDNAIAILCRRYRDSVMCVHQEVGARATIVPAYERGMSMPLFAGASSKAILIGLDDRSLKRLYLDNEVSIRSSFEVDGWSGFRNTLKTLRKTGTVVTRSEVTPGLVGIAAPVGAARPAAASISLIMTETDFAAMDSERGRRFVKAAAVALSEQAASHELWVSR